MDCDVSAEDPDELFKSMYSDVSEEQWEQYREQIKYGHYFLDDSDEDDSNCSDRSISPHGDEEHITNVELVEEEENEEDETGEMISWGCDAADRYAEGTISFTELTDIMEVRPRGRPRKKRKIDDEEKTKTSQEDNLEEGEGSGRKKKKVRRKANVLPKELEGLMGAANLAYAKGNTEDAIKMCMELIRSAPTANEPFQTLAIIYDEMGDTRKSFQCYLVAASLNPSDTEEWIRLAEISLEQNEIQQAIKCFSKAIKNEPNNINFLWERCNLYEQVGERKRALAGYEMIIKHLSSPEDGEKCVDMAREIAKVHHENTDDGNAVKVLETAFIKFPSLITSEDVNFLLELQLSQKLFKSAVKTFVLHCGVKLEIPSGEIDSLDDLDEFTEDFKTLLCCNVPEVLPIDLVVKFLICLIHLKCVSTMKPLLHSILQENPDEIGDLHLDVAEALMENKEHSMARPLLELLLSTSTYDLPAVWMRFADCLRELGQLEDAIRAYEKVISVAPGYQEARLALSQIYLSKGKKDEAMKILRQELEYEEIGEAAVVGIEALYQRCKLLESEQNWDEWLTAAILLQYSHCHYLETDEEFSAAISNQTARRRNDAIKELKRDSNRNVPEFVGQMVVPLEEMWDMFKKTCDMLLQQKRFEELQTLSLAGLTSTMFMKNSSYTRDLEFQSLLSCYFNGSHQYTYLLVRDLVVKNLHNNKAWNLFALFVTQAQENRHNRFCLRLMMKNQDHLALGFLNGHNAMISGTYKHALGEYMCILKEHPDDTFTLFCVGIIFIHMACQKFATKRHLLTIQGFAFLLKYLKVKGECQEALYNIGRSLHQLGIKDGAIHFYKKALFCPPALTESDSITFDLRREIAYNLSLIYQATGAMDLVYLYTRKYIVV